MQTTDEGTYLEIDGRPAVRFERIYDHPVARVWAAVTEPEEMRHWFPSPEVRRRPDRRVDHRLRRPVLTGPEDQPRPGVGAPAPVRVRVGGRRAAPHAERARPGLPARAGQHPLDPGAGARNAAGWEMCLELLDRVVAGSRQGSASDAGMEEFLPVLEKYKAKGVPDDGWLPDPPQR